MVLCCSFIKAAPERCILGDCPEDAKKDKVLDVQVTPLGRAHILEALLKSEKQEVIDGIKGEDFPDFYFSAGEINCKNPEVPGPFDGCDLKTPDKSFYDERTPKVEKYFKDLCSSQNRDELLNEGEFFAYYCEKNRDEAVKTCRKHSVSRTKKFCSWLKENEINEKEICSAKNFDKLDLSHKWMYCFGLPTILDRTTRLSNAGDPIPTRFDFSKMKLKNLDVGDIKVKKGNDGSLIVDIEVKNLEANFNLDLSDMRDEQNYLSNNGLTIKQSSPRPLHFTLKIVPNQNTVSNRYQKKDLFEITDIGFDLKPDDITIINSDVSKLYSQEGTRIVDEFFKEFKKEDQNYTICREYGEYHIREKTKGPKCGSKVKTAFLKKYKPEGSRRAQFADIIKNFPARADEILKQIDKGKKYSFCREGDGLKFKKKGSKGCGQEAYDYFDNNYDSEYHKKRAIMAMILLFPNDKKIEEIFNDAINVSDLNLCMIEGKFSYRPNEGPRCGEIVTEEFNQKYNTDKKRADAFRDLIHRHINDETLSSGPLKSWSQTSIFLSVYGGFFKRSVINKNVFKSLFKFALNDEFGDEKTSLGGVIKEKANDIIKGNNDFTLPIPWSAQNIMDFEKVEKSFKQFKKLDATYVEKADGIEGSGIDLFLDDSATDNEFYQWFAAYYKNDVEGILDMYSTSESLEHVDHLEQVKKILEKQIASLTPLEEDNGEIVDYPIKQLKKQLKRVQGIQDKIKEKHDKSIYPVFINHAFTDKLQNLNLAIRKGPACKEKERPESKDFACTKEHDLSMTLNFDFINGLMSDLNDRGFFNLCLSDDLLRACEDDLAAQEVALHPESPPRFVYNPETKSLELDIKSFKVVTNKFIDSIPILGGRKRVLGIPIPGFGIGTEFKDVHIQSQPSVQNGRLNLNASSEVKWDLDIKDQDFFIKRAFNAVSLVYLPFVTVPLFLTENLMIDSAIKSKLAEIENLKLDIDFEVQDIKYGPDGVKVCFEQKKSTIVK
jgi:hypothetical protein